MKICNYLLAIILTLLFYSCKKYTEYEFYDYDEPVVVDFDYTNYENGKVSFKNLTTGPVENATWLWDFGDGTISNEKSPTHAYTIKGLYLVKLSIELDINKKMDNTKTIYVSDIYYSFTDTRDGHTYKYIKIGNDYWMIENLAYKPVYGNYRAYNNDESNVEDYGYLYDWETARNACPEGWHLPIYKEWLDLINYLGGENIAGGKMKETGLFYWTYPNTGADNSSGFSALPGGMFDENGNFSNLYYNGYWWCATEVSAGNSYCYKLNYNTKKITWDNTNKLLGLSVRCVKD